MSATILHFRRPEPEPVSEVEAAFCRLVDYFGRRGDHLEHISFDDLVRHLGNRGTTLHMAERAAAEWQGW